MRHAQTRTSIRPSRITKMVASVAAMLLLALTLSACEVSIPGVNVTQGSGTIKTETRAVSGFTGVALRGAGTLTIRQGNTESLTITTDDNLLPLLTSTVNNGVLELSGKERTIPRPTDGIKWDVTVKNLNSVSLTGAGIVNVENLNTSSLDTKISGAGTMNVSGRASAQSISVTGAGNYNGRNFTAPTATVNISGAGNAFVNASEALDATVSGAGVVTYYGTPKVTQHISGAGTVRQGR
ncbi:MAG TPA: head GIN domain-containing protein [Ktedonobacterales bacterium]|nr:head GIN domain-containing protein [Ktedonobacterales bacterium]